MLVMRNHPKGARFASFGLALCVFTLMPNQIGYQDIASLLARQPGVAERWQKRVYSPAASIQLATYSFGSPLGTSAPESATYILASLDGQGADVAGSASRNPVLRAAPRYQAAEFPKVDRTLKGDRLVPRSCRAGAGERGPGGQAVATPGSRDLQRLRLPREDRSHAVGRQGAARS